MGVFTLDELVTDDTSADEVLETSPVGVALEMNVALEYSLQAQSQPEGVVAHQQSDDLVLQTCWDSFSLVGYSIFVQAKNYILILCGF